MQKIQTSAHSSGSKRSIVGMSENALRTFCKEHGFDEYHGSQIFHWIYRLGATSFEEMSDLPGTLRRELVSRFHILILHPVEKKVSKCKDAVKYKFSVPPDLSFEAVVLLTRDRRPSFCISSQVGCPAGCLFCATGSMGLVRNLTGEQIISQVLALSRFHATPFSILFMGMGEPLLNIKHLIEALTFFNAIDLSCKRITVSTCGVVPGIKTLSTSGLRPRLAVSLGAALEEKRREMIPLAKKWPLRELEKAIILYREKTRRRVSIEYTLIGRINDTVKDARSLALFAKRCRCHVNLIRYNRVIGKEYSPPDTETVKRFVAILQNARVEVSERYRKGADIDAACGQLVTAKGR
jgi:23S rRNA (adenine2503-C2)-methyltransferase